MNYNSTRPVDTEELRMTVGKLWDKVEHKFAEKPEVIRLAKELKRLDSQSVTQAVQSGEDGPVFLAGSDQTIHVKYEDWVETTVTDASGETHYAYNDSQNALTAAAAALVIKQIRAESSRVSGMSVVVCDKIDTYGQPVVKNLSFNTLYLAPPKPKNDGCNIETTNGVTSDWVEWIAVPNNSSSSKRSPYIWKRIGVRDIDISWVKGNIVDLNCEIKKLEHKLNKYSHSIAKAMLERAVKPIEELQHYIKSKEFINYVTDQLPRADIAQDGLMSSNSFNLLNMIAMWVSNDHHIMGGGAMSAYDVIEMLAKEGVDTTALKEQYIVNKNLY